MTFSVCYVVAYSAHLNKKNESQKGNVDYYILGKSTREVRMLFTDGGNGYIRNISIKENLFICNAYVFI